MFNPFKTAKGTKGSGSVLRQTNHSVSAPELVRTVNRAMMAVLGGGHSVSPADRSDLAVLAIELESTMFSNDI